MIKDTNVQRTIVIPKEIAEKIDKEAKEYYCSSSAVVKKILIAYYKNKKFYD